MPAVMCASEPVDVGGHLDIEFCNVLGEHGEHLGKFFPFSRHLLSRSSRKITAAGFNVINSSSPTSQLIGSFRPLRRVNGTFITASTHSHPLCRKYCSYNTSFLLSFLVFWTNDSEPCSPDSMIGTIVSPDSWIIIEKKFTIVITFSSTFLNFNCCFTVHFDKYKTILPTNAPFIKTQNATIYI